VSAEGEQYGLDLHEHGIPAYPEYVISSTARPAGMIGSDAAQPYAHPVVEPKLREANS